LSIYTTTNLDIVFALNIINTVEILLYVTSCRGAVGAVEGVVVDVRVAGSNMHLKYLHYFGNESNDSILVAYGMISKGKQISEALRPKQCPNCNEPNKPDSKFCAKCRMVLTYDAYSETLESEKQKEDRVTILEKQNAIAGIDTLNSQNRAR